MNKLAQFLDFSSPKSWRNPDNHWALHACLSSAVLFGQFVVFQTLNTDVVEIYDGSLTNSGLLSSIYGSHSGNNLILHAFIYFSFFIYLS